MDAIPASTEGEGTKMGVSIFDELSKEAFLGIGFEPMAIDLPMIWSGSCRGAWGMGVP